MLPPRREKFCHEYLVDFNGTQAALRAGYAEVGAKQEGSRLLTRADVRLRVAELSDGVTERTKLTAESVLADIALIKYSCVESNPTVALKAAELEARYLGLLTDRLDINANVKTESTYYIEYVKCNATKNTRDTSVPDVTKAS